MKHIRLYNNFDEFASAETVTVNEEYVSTVVPGLAGIRTDSNAIWYNLVEFNRKMTVEELIANGYAELKQDRARTYAGSETAYTVVQIHTECPIKLENITNFDTWLESATTFVWREPLPNKWNPKALAEKYSGATLARPIIPEMFPCVDLSGVDELSLSFVGKTWQYPQSSIISQRYDANRNYYPGITFKTPKHLTITLRGDYSSVAITNFSMLSTTTGITINCNGFFDCHDVTGMFEFDPNLKSLTINGQFCWGGMKTCHLLFDAANKLESIPYSTAWTREHTYNTIYPVSLSNGRGGADCCGIFNATGLTYIGPRLNMNAMSLSGCIVDGVSQQPLGTIVTDNKQVFNCPNCTDVRIINLNNNDWNFADKTTYTYLPKIDTASIEYILNNVVDCSANPHTVTFSNLHQNDVSASAISAAAAKGWTVAWQN